MKLKNLFKGRKGKEKEPNNKNWQKKEQKNNQNQERTDNAESVDKERIKVSSGNEDKPQKEKPREERIKLIEHAYGYPSEVDGTEVDVILEVPEIKVDKIEINVEDIEARVNLHVKALELVKVDAGVNANLDQVKVEIKGVRAEAYLQARLERVKSVLFRAMEMLDNNANVLTEVLKPIGQGAKKATKEVGKGAGDAVSEVGEGAGNTLSDVGEGTQKAAK